MSLTKAGILHLIYRPVKEIWTVVVKMTTTKLLTGQQESCFLILSPKLKNKPTVGLKHNVSLLFLQLITSDLKGFVPRFARTMKVKSRSKVRIITHSPTMKIIHV